MTSLHSPSISPSLTLVCVALAASEALLVAHGRGREAGEGTCPILFDKTNSLPVHPCSSV